MFRTFKILALGLTLSACSEPGSTISASTGLESRREKAMSRPEEQSFDGWGPFVFGMVFADALTAYPGVAWDAGAVRKCRAEIGTRPCTLEAADGLQLPPLAGIAMRPSLLFNQPGKLAAIRLQNFLRGDIDLNRCKSVHDRLREHLRESWGAPAAKPLQSMGAGGGAVIDRDSFQSRPDGRGIILETSYIGAAESGSAVCHLSIAYRGPQSLQPPPEDRPHPLKNWY